MQILNILSIALITLFGILGLFLMFEGKRIQNRWLGLFFLLMGLNFLDGILLLSGFYSKYPNLAFWEDPMAFLWGPMILFYTRSLITGSSGFKTRDALHLLPFVVLELVTIITIQLESPDFKREIISSLLESRQPQAIFLPVVIIFLQLFAYVLYSKRLIRGFNKELQDYYSTIDISWFVRIINLLLVILVLSLFTAIIQYFGPQGSFQITLVFLMAAMLAFIINVLFMALRQPIFRYHEQVPKVESVSENEIGNIREKIIDVLELEKVFLDPELSLDQLSERIGISSRQVSYVINQAFAQNFYELVNGYRIKEAQKVFDESEDPKLTVLEVIYQVGFNSKSSFNTQFKKITGQTPSEYRKAQR